MKIVFRLLFFPSQDRAEERSQGIHTTSKRSVWARSVRYVGGYLQLGAYVNSALIVFKYIGGLRALRIFSIKALRLGV